MAFVRTDNAGAATPGGLKDKLVRREVEAKRLREDFEEHFRELGQYILPRRSRFDNQSRNKRGSKLNRKILNSRGTLALRTLQSGMQVGITSPARPWFRLVPRDFDLRLIGSVRDYVGSVERIMRQHFQSTGTYNALHTGYGDLGLFGTDAAILDEHPKQVFVLHQLVPGEFWVLPNDVNEIDGVYTETWMTVEQVVGRFVYASDPLTQPDWTRVSGTVKNLWDKGQRSEMILISRIVEPRKERDPRRLTEDNRPIASVWWEHGASEDRVLRNSGYTYNPVIASRWYKTGMEAYGRSPGMDALPDVMQLQQQERDKAEAVARMNRPAMNAPTELRNSPFSLLPGSINFNDLDRGLVPAYEVNPPVQHMRAEIAETENRLDEAFYANLFLMMARLDRRQITAREVDERHEEKLIGLGPVLELQHKEKLRPLILNVYNILNRRGVLPPVPPEVADKTFQIDYVSMLAQAQKAVETGGVERLSAFVGNIAAVKPSVLDKIDEDKAVDEYAEMLGTPPSIVRDQDEVDGIREQRARQEQAQQQAETATQLAPAAREGAEAARVLSEASEPRGPAPRDVLNRIGLGR